MVSSASLLTAVDLPELVANTNDEYEKTIIHFASNPSALRAVKDKLAATRLKSPLFDSEGYTRAFEAGLQETVDRLRADKPVDDIWVNPK